MPTELKDISDLPPFDWASDFPVDFDRMADDMFRREYQGLLDAGDYGLVAYRNADLRALGNHDGVSHQEHLFGNEEEGGMDRFMRFSTFGMRPPKHRAAKGIVSRQLSAKSIDRFSDTASRLAEDLIDAAAERDEIDFGPDFLQPLLARFWGHVLGLTTEETDQVQGLLDDFFLPFLLAPSEEDIAAADRAANGFIDLMTHALEREMQAGTHEILVDLAADFGSMPTEDRPSNVCTHFGVAFPDAFNTARSLTANTVYSLLVYPDALAQVRADQSLVGNAWLEGSRLHPAVIGTQRGTMEDVEYDGVLLRNGTGIMMMWAFGNRDPAVYEQPNEYRLHRALRTRQTTFGTGLYICPGRHSARLIGETVIRALTDSSVSIELTGDVEWTSASFLHDPVRMPVAIRRA